MLNYRPTAQEMTVGGEFILYAPEGTDSTVLLTWDASADVDLDHYLIRLTDNAAGEFYRRRPVTACAWSWHHHLPSGQ